MANQAEKKRQKNAEVSIVYYQGSVLLINLIYFTVIVLYDLQSFGFWNVLEAGLFTGVSYATFSGIQHALQLGTDYSTFQDIFIVNLFVQLGVCYSRYFWYVYLVVPAYATYKAWGFVKGMVFFDTLKFS